MLLVCERMFIYKYAMTSMPPIFNLPIILWNLGLSAYEETAWALHSLSHAAHLDTLSQYLAESLSRDERLTEGPLFSSRVTLRRTLSRASSMRRTTSTMRRTTMTESSAGRGKVARRRCAQSTVRALARSVCDASSLSGRLK